LIKTVSLENTLFNVAPRAANCKGVKKGRSQLMPAAIAGCGDGPTAIIGIAPGCVVTVRESRYRRIQQTGHCKAFGKTLQLAHIPQPMVLWQGGRGRSQDLRGHLECTRCSASGTSRAAIGRHKQQRPAAAGLVNRLRDHFLPNPLSPWINTVASLRRVITSQRLTGSCISGDTATNCAAL
jgi:hypothetical protein